MKGGIRIRLPLEAVIVLETLYREGMTTNKRTDLVQKAVETTGLDRVKVKNWIQNRRGKARRRDPNFAAQRTAATANFSSSSSAPGTKPLPLAGSNPVRTYKRPRSASTGSLNLHHPQFITPFNMKKVDKQEDRKDVAEKTWAEVSQALTVLAYHGYHFVCSVYSSEDNFMAVRSSGYGARFLSTIQGDKGVENLWKAVEVLEKSNRRTAKLIDDARQAGGDKSVLPEGTGAGKRSMSESDSEIDDNDEDYDSEDSDDDSDDADEESKEVAAGMDGSASGGVRPPPSSSTTTSLQVQGHVRFSTNSTKPQAVSSSHSTLTQHSSAPSSESRRDDDVDVDENPSAAKRRSSASSTSAAMTLATLADAVFAAATSVDQQQQQRDASSSTAVVSPNRDPVVAHLAAAAVVRSTKNNSTTPGADHLRFGNAVGTKVDSTKLPSPSAIASVAGTYTSASQQTAPHHHHHPSYGTHSPVTGAQPHVPPAWNTVGSIMLSKQGSKASYSHPLLQHDLPVRAAVQPYERNRTMEDNILPLPNIQSYNTTVAGDASSKHGGRFGGMAP